MSENTKDKARKLKAKRSLSGQKCEVTRIKMFQLIDKIESLDLDDTSKEEVIEEIKKAREEVAIKEQ